MSNLKGNIIRFMQEMESLKTKNQLLKSEKEKSDAKHENEMSGVLEKHNKELQDLENANNQKLMMEYEKYQELQNKTQKIQEDYERQLSEMEESKEKAINEMQELYEDKIHKCELQIQKVWGLSPENIRARVGLTVGFQVTTRDRTVEQRIRGDQAANRGGLRHRGDQTEREVREAAQGANRVDREVYGRG